MALANPGRVHTLQIMPKFEFCIPTVGKAVPIGDDWFHEVKYDGYRLRIERDGPSVRLIIRGGHDWTRRFPWIVEAALKNRRKQFVIDGEAVILGVTACRISTRCIPVSTMARYRSAPSMRWPSMVTICATCRCRCARRTSSDCCGRADGIFVNPFETGAIGPDLFRVACSMGLEGLVSKRGDRPYRAGRSPYGIKVKNRSLHAFDRVAESFR